MADLAFQANAFQTDAFQTGQIVATLSQSIGLITGTRSAAVTVAPTVNKSIGLITGTRELDVIVKPTVNATILPFTGTRSAAVVVKPTLSQSIGLIGGVRTLGQFLGAYMTQSIGLIGGTRSAAVVVKPTVSKIFGIIALDTRIATYYRFPLTIPPDYPLPVRRNVEMSEMGYGAYKERLPFGIYANQEKEVQLRWGALTQAQKDELQAFLEERGGAGRFKYRVPHWDNEETFVCQRWSLGLAMPGADQAGIRRHTLTATFSRRFDPTQG